MSNTAQTVHQSDRQLPKPSPLSPPPPLKAKAKAKEALEQKRDSLEDAMATDEGRVFVCVFVGCMR